MGLPPEKSSMDDILIYHPALGVAPSYLRKAPYATPGPDEIQQLYQGPDMGLSENG